MMGRIKAKAAPADALTRMYRKRAAETEGRLPAVAQISRAWGAAAPPAEKPAEGALEAGRYTFTIGDGLTREQRLEAIRRSLELKISSAGTPHEADALRRLQQRLAKM